MVNNINMKNYLRYILFLIIFLLFIFQDNIYGLLYKNNPDVLKCNITQEESSKKLQELENLLDIKSNDYNYVISKVIYRNIYGFSNELTISKGKNYGIKNNNAVVNDSGLVGIINNSYKNNSRVQLLTNKNTEISVRINNSYGILKKSKDTLYVDNITNSEIISIGDLVYTSGIGNLPGDILIGKVSSIKIDKLGIEQILLITPVVDFNNINYVMVILNDSITN